MRNISFALTTEQIRNRTKTVTRRLGWLDLQPGEVLQPVRKSQGLKKGERVDAPLNAITPQDVHREGFPQMTREQFIAMFKKSHKGCRVGTVVTRIEFEYM